MALGNLSSRVSSKDMEKLERIENPPEFEEGFEGGDDMGDFEGIFDSLDDYGGSGDDSFFAQGEGGMSEFDDLDSEFDLSGGTADEYGKRQEMVPKEPDRLDKLMDASVEAGKVGYNVFKDMLRTVGVRTGDEWGDFAMNMIKIGGALVALSVVIGIIGSVGNINGIKIGQVPLDGIVTGIVCVGEGILVLGIGGMLLAIQKKKGVNGYGLEDIEDLGCEEGLSYAEIEGEEFGDMEFDDGELSDSEFDSNEISDDDFDFDTADIEAELEAELEEEMEREEVSKFNVNTGATDYDKIIEEVTANKGILNRRTLMETFLPFLRVNTPDFAKREKLDEDSQEYKTIKILTLKAFMAAFKKSDLEEIKNEIVSIYDAYFSYEINVTRDFKGNSNLAVIELEIASQFRESSEDTSVSAKVSIEGDTYKILVVKGKDNIVTLGDCMQLEEVKKYFMDENNKLPVILGIDSLGKPQLVDGKILDAIMTAGKQRSGKSWYVFCIVLTWMMFNTPDDIEFTIIDPKGASLFRHLALMPHVCGLNNNDKVLQVLEDVKVEAERRKRLLEDNEVDSIWELRDEVGVKLPILYIIVDEVATVVNELGKDGATEFNTLLNIIITQYPSLGIRLWIVPHRAKGVVDKGNRAMISMAAAVKLNAEDTKDTLGVSKFDIPLTKPGDVGLITGDMEEGKYVKAVAIETSDGNLRKFIKSIAKAYYKMGVSIPDMSNIGAGYNRDQEKIDAKLRGEAKGMELVQRDFEKIDRGEEEALDMFDSVDEWDK